MKYDYPEHTMMTLRLHHFLDKHDTSRDEEFKGFSPQDVFSMLMEYEGIVGYGSSILRNIQNVWGVCLDKHNWLCPEEYTKKDLVRGLGSIISNFPDGETAGVVKMEMDEDELVTVTFKGGGIKYANVAMDSFTATLRDILFQALR